MKALPTLIVIALAVLLEACTSTEDQRTGRVISHRGATAELTNSAPYDLRNSPALSSSASLPNPRTTRDASGRSADMDPIMNASSPLLPPHAHADSASPLVGTVPGGNSWP